MVVSSNGAIMTTKLVTQPTGEATHATSNKTKCSEHILKSLCVCLFIYLCLFVYMYLHIYQPYKWIITLECVNSYPGHLHKTHC